MRGINNIIIHCSAGFGDIDSMKKFWKETLGWRSPGYHIVIDLEGRINIIHPLEKPSNGVKGFNGNSINISYIGGVDPSNYKIAKDTRTEAQKEAIKIAIFYVIGFLKSSQHEIPEIKGHRDFSPDQNCDGIISSWERIKECPSFEVIEEYKWITDLYVVNNR